MKIIKKEILFKGHYQLNKLKVRSYKSGKISEREQFQTPDSVGVLVYDTQLKSVVLVKQFRIGPEKALTEIVAGKIEGKDMDKEKTAHREVLEEVGYSIDKLEAIHEFHTCPGPVTECMQLYYAEVSAQKNEGGGLAEENEEIEVLFTPIDEFLNSTFRDAKTIIAQQWIKLKFNS
jgi:ADP-ribose pyrophosphatase